MSNRRIERLNSLLREVISDVIHTKVKNPHLPPLITVTSVSITKDMRLAKVYVSVLGNKDARDSAIKILQSASGFIGLQSSKEVILHYFPELTFYLDDSVDKQMRIEELLDTINKKDKTSQ